MRIILTISLTVAMLATGPATGKQVKKAPRPAHGKFSGFIPEPALLEATKEVTSCASKAAPGRPTEICDRTWKGIKWMLASNWNGQLDLPNGQRWMVSCKYDAIYRVDRCTFSTGDQFAIVRSDGYATLLLTGFKRFPRSAMTVRFDNDAPISTTAETWTDEQSRALYLRMMTGQLMRFRFADWPENASQDRRINLSQFADAAALMEAIRNEYTVARVLKKIDVAD